MTPEQVRALWLLRTALADALMRVEIYRDVAAREGCPTKPFDDEIADLQQKQERVERWLTT